METNGQAPHLFHAIGGTPGCRRLSEAFYARVDRDPLLRPLFPGSTLHCAIEEFAAFLVQFLGGPGEDSQRRWWLSLHESHQRFKADGRHRDAWLRDMVLALNDVEIEEPARTALRDLFAHASAYVELGHSPSKRAEARSTTTGRSALVGRASARQANAIDAKPPGRLSPEMAIRWSAQQALDETVAAIRAGAADRAANLAASCDRAVLPGVLALMIGRHDPEMLRYVQERLTAEPALVHERYAGRTLLHNAAGAGSLSTVELLLQLGADPNALDGGKHTPLYCAGNECGSAESAHLVRALVRSGARVDAHDGVTGATPLHMAARRGNVAVARALLDCGANRAARDRRGDSPLQRAINCKKLQAAELLRTY